MSLEDQFQKLDAFPTDEQNRIIKRAIRLLMYQARTYGPVDEKTIFQFVDNCADYKLSHKASRA